MKISYAFVPSLILSLSLSAGRPAYASDGEDFQKAYQAWTEACVDMQARHRLEKIAADEAKRPPDYNKVTDEIHSEYLSNPGKSKGHQAMRLNVQSSQILLRLRTPSLGFPVETLEKELRALWAQQYKPDRTTDLRDLYNRYAGEKKYTEAVRIAEEGYAEYGWSWEARDWLDTLITATVYATNGVRMGACIDLFANQHVAEAGADALLNKYLSYLESLTRWDQAARIVELCLRTYKDCDWEPDFLHHAVIIHTTRATAPVPAGGDTNAAQAASSNAMKRALAVAMRCAERYPNEPQASLAVLRFCQRAMAGGAGTTAVKEAVGELIAKYLTASKTNPYWVEIYAAAGPFVQAKPELWAELMAEASVQATNRVRREAELKTVMATAANDQADFVKGVCAFAEANPDTPQARTAMAGLIGAVVGGWVGDDEHLFGIVKTIKTAFPASPVFRSQQLQKLAQVQVVAVGDAIYNDLFASPACPLQSEWYYGENCRRRLLHGYSMEAFRAYVTKHRTSYFIPGLFAWLVQRAIYDGRYEDAAEACEIVADPRYATSLTVGKQLAANVQQYLFLARNLALAALEDPKAAGAKRQPTKPGSARPSKGSVTRDYAAQASQQANLVDRAQSKYINLGYLYYGASLWGKDLHFTARSGATGRTVLRQKEYRDSFWYYYSGAYQQGP